MTAWRAIALVLITYWFSLVGGYYFVIWGLDFFLGKNRQGKTHPRAWGVGCIERFIYTSSLLLGLPFAVIGGWLVLKGLVQFNPKGTDKVSTGDFLTDYYSYLIGTGLSLIAGVGFGFLGALAQTSAFAATYLLGRKLRWIRTGADGSHSGKLPPLARREGLSVIADFNNRNGETSNGMA